MPQLPRRASGVSPELARLPVRESDIRSAAQPGLAAARLGEQVASIASDWLEKETTLRRNSDYNQRMTDAKLELDAFMRNQEANPEFRDHETRITAGLDSIAKRTLQGVKDAQLKQALTADLGELRGTAIVKARSFMRLKEIDFGAAELIRANEADLKLGTAATGQELQDITEGVAARLIRAERAGLISAQDREKLADAWFEKLDRSHLARDMRLNPKETMERLKDPAQYPGLDPEYRQLQIGEAERAYIAEGERKRREEAYAIAVEDRAQEALGQDIYRRKLAGEDVTALLAENAETLGERYKPTVEAVLELDTMKGNTAITFSDQAVVSEFKARLGGSDLPSRREVLSSPYLNATDKQFLLNAIEARRDRDRDAPLSPRQQASLQDGEEFIKRRLTIAIPGVSGYTEVKGEAQSIAVNETLIDYFDLARDTIAKGQFFDGRRVGNELAAQKRVGPLYQEGIIKMDADGGTLNVYGATTIEDVDAELDRRVVSGEITKETARFLRNRAATLPHKEAPKPLPIEIPGGGYIPII